MLVIQRLRMTETEGPEESGRGSVSPRQSVHCLAVDTVTFCPVMRHSASLSCIAAFPCLTLSYRSGKNGTLNNL